MSGPLAYTRKQFVIAVTVSAILGWACIAVPSLFLGGFSFFLWTAVFGLPIAFLVCWLFVAPVLWRVMRKEITLGVAVRWGAIISTTMALISIAIGRYVGWRHSLDTTSYTQLGGGAFTREVNGILTNYGWMLLGIKTAGFILAGIAIALFVRWIIGPATSAQHDR